MITVEQVEKKLRDTRPFSSFTRAELSKFLMFLEAVEELRSEEEERIHEDAYAAATEDKMYGSD